MKPRFKEGRLKQENKIYETNLSIVKLQIVSWWHIKKNFKLTNTINKTISQMSAMKDII